MKKGTRMTNCVKICKLDDGKCSGCGRTLNEIREYGKNHKSHKAPRMVQTLPPISEEALLEKGKEEC